MQLEFYKDSARDWIKTLIYDVTKVSLTSHITSMFPSETRPTNWVVIAEKSDIVSTVQGVTAKPSGAQVRAGHPKARIIFIY